jgi:hypothetical protein
MEEDIELENDAEEQQDISKVPKQLQPHVYKKGQSGNPNGRPAGSLSLKEYLKKKLATMTDEEREEYLDGIDKHKIWEMAEGKASQDVDHTTLGKELPAPIINVLTNNSDAEGDKPQEED